MGRTESENLAEAAKRYEEARLQLEYKSIGLDFQHNHPEVTFTQADSGILSAWIEANMPVDSPFSVAVLEKAFAAVKERLSFWKAKAAVMAPPPTPVKSAEELDIEKFNQELDSDPSTQLPSTWAKLYVPKDVLDLESYSLCFHSERWGANFRNRVGRIMSKYGVQQRHGFSGRG